MSRRMPTPTELRKLLRYDAPTGKLFWKERGLECFEDGKRFKADHAMKRWNTVFAGKEAFRTIHPDGYLMGKVFQTLLLAHRVVWVIINGDWPQDEIDHIDGDRSNNRIRNLRIASRNDNMRNTGVRVNNTSGVSGVYRAKRSGKWVAGIKHAKKRYHLGQFDTLDEAVEARKAAEVRFGFHANHGRARAMEASDVEE